MIDTESRLLRRGDYIWGSFVRTGPVDGYIVAVNPGDRSDVLGRFAFTVTAVDEAVGAAHEGRRAWQDTPLEDRGEIVGRFRELLDEVGENLALLITRETGKPLWESRAEVSATARAAKLLVSDGLPLLQPKVLREDTAWSERVPLGVVGVVTPFTYPLLLPSLHCLAALLAGNTVVFKPSKFAPGVGQALAELLDRCRLPRGAFNMVQGSGASVGARLVSHPGLDALLFTGSYDTACKVRAATADRPELPVLLQAGGKAAALVLADADLDLAAYEIAVSAFATAGQRHDAAARVFVDRAIFDTFCERLLARTQELVVGYGFDHGVFMGPMISDAHRKRFRAYADDLQALGHTPVLEGGTAQLDGPRGYYVRPAIYWITRDGALDAEPPGPMVQVYCVTDTDHMVSLHEQLASRVSAAIFTRDEGGAMELAQRLTTGAVYVNRGTSATSLRMPAVPRGRSTNGVPHGAELVRWLTSPQALLVDRRPFDGSRFVPGAGSLPTAPMVIEPDDEG
ncbi:MAG: aldehyde dehydrogenase family protein [Alphaproteobacteria bacterium]|nr:aldehyde dehydrogenase family protein [Alphaproteobacteria bacterium]